MAHKKKEFRAFGAVLEHINELVPSGYSAQVVSFLSSFPNFGVGELAPIDSDEVNWFQLVMFLHFNNKVETKASQAKLFYKEIAKRLLKKYVQVNTICCGLRQFHAPILNIISNDTGGHIVMQREIDSNISKTLVYLLNKRKICYLVKRDFRSLTIL